MQSTITAEYFRRSLPSTTEVYHKEIFSTENLENKMDFTLNIASEVEDMLKSDKIVREITDIAIKQIDRIISNKELDYVANLFLSSDPEIEGLRELVISIHVKEESFDERMEIWDLIDSKIKEEIEALRGKYPDDTIQIDNIDKNFVISIKPF